MIALSSRSCKCVWLPTATPMCLLCPRRYTDLAHEAYLLFRRQYILLFLSVSSPNLTPAFYPPGTASARKSGNREKCRTCHWIRCSGIPTWCRTSHRGIYRFQQIIQRCGSPVVHFHFYRDKRIRISDKEIHFKSRLIGQPLHTADVISVANIIIFTLSDIQSTRNFTLSGLLSPYFSHYPQTSFLANCPLYDRKLFQIIKLTMRNEDTQ